MIFLLGMRHAFYVTGFTKLFVYLLKLTLRIQVLCELCRWLYCVLCSALFSKFIVSFIVLIFSSYVLNVLMCIRFHVPGSSLQTNTAFYLSVVVELGEVLSGKK